MTNNNDYNSLLEQFSKLLTANPTANFTDVIKTCTQNAPKVLADQLIKETTDYANDLINNCVVYYKQSLQEGKDTTNLLKIWKETTPVDIYTQLLNALNITTPATTCGPQTADFEQLSNYINAGFGIYPCTYENGVTSPICKIKDANNTVIESNRITTKEQLKDFMNGTGTCYTADGRPWTNQRKIELFAIYPKQNELFCIDIDSTSKQDGTKHGTGTNGINEFLHIIRKIDLTEKQKKMFENFPVNFPCYVTTPNGGIHLYFKCVELPAKWNLESNIIDQNERTNVECKFNKQITIAGSIKNGKRYELHGNLADIPIIPLDLLNACCKPRQKQTPYFSKRNYAKQDNGERITPQFCLDRGKKYAGNGGHNEMFASVVSNFHYFYEQTQKPELNATNCKSWIMQDFDFISWQDSDKETQLDRTIRQFYGKV